MARSKLNPTQPCAGQGLECSLKRKLRGLIIDSFPDQALVEIQGSMKIDEKEPISGIQNVSEAGPFSDPPRATQSCQLGSILTRSHRPVDFGSHGLLPAGVVLDATAIGQKKRPRRQVDETPKRPFWRPSVTERDKTSDDGTWRLDMKPLFGNPISLATNGYLFAPGVWTVLAADFFSWCFRSAVAPLGFAVAASNFSSAPPTTDVSVGGQRAENAPNCGSAQQEPRTWLCSGRPRWIGARTWARTIRASNANGGLTVVFRASASHLCLELGGAGTKYFVSHRDHDRTGCNPDLAPRPD